MDNQSWFKSSEWCQPQSIKPLPINGSITRNIDSSAAAFIASDFSLRDKRKRPLTYSAILDSSSVSYCDTYWRYQNNKNNGEIVTYEHNDLKYSHCYIDAALRILSWDDCLGIHVDIPIAVPMVVIKKRKLLSYITSITVTKHLQVAAKAAHGIKTAKSLSRISPHSIRVGAYVLMDTTDEKVHHIKKAALEVRYMYGLSP